MDKLTIVMDNYTDVECDANTTPRQAYERGFRRATEKCEAVIRSCKAENAKLRSERDHWRVEQLHAYGNWEDTHKYATSLEAENAKLRELVAGYAVVAGNLCSDGFDCAPESGCRYYHQSKGRPQCVLGELNGKAKELGIEVE